MVLAAAELQADGGAVPDHSPALQAEPALSEPCADPICEQVTLTDADVDKVTFDTGVASFLQQGVDKKLKQAALAKLFHSDEFNYISDMDDHTEDFSNIPKLDEGIAKQLRGWVKAALTEPEETDEAIADSDALVDTEAEITSVSEIADADADKKPLPQTDET